MLRFVVSLHNAPRVQYTKPSIIGAGGILNKNFLIFNAFNSLDNRRGHNINKITFDKKYD